jgi:hypothetical protein
MSSKTFIQAPKPRLVETPPSAEVITAFERRGPGQDTQAHILVNAVKETSSAAEPATTAKPTKRAEQPTEPILRMSIDIPESLHRRLKVACAKHRKKMRFEAVSALERRTAQLEKE